MTSIDIADRGSLERQITLARVGLPLLAAATLLERSGWDSARQAFLVAIAYFLAGSIFAGMSALQDQVRLRFPIWFDVLASTVFLSVTPSIVAFWFLFLVPVFALAICDKQRLAFILSVAGSLGVVIRAAIRVPARGHSFAIWLALGACTLLLSAGVAFVGGRENFQLRRRRFLQAILSRLQFNRGLSEAIRQVLGEAALAFQCEVAYLVIRDDELERLFVWKVRPSDGQPLAPETHSLSQSEFFLLDCLEVTLCWNALEGERQGFGWDRRTFETYKNPPGPSAGALTQLDARSLMAATIESEGRPGGRIILVNGRRRFTPADLSWFEEIVNQANVPLENIFVLRHIRAHAIEAERSRISRDLHDSILQTLLSLQIQLDVLKRKVAGQPEQLTGELEELKQTVRHEADELRRMVTDLRPVRVESADLRELMFGFAERFQREAEMAVDLFIEDGDLRVPDRICREIFQIYRESLNNIKKHAHASHVVVKLGQDEARVSLVVDDNGLGFSFSGRYSSEELDRLRIGPISIKERTRSVGGTLTVESNPGHGARLTVEIPLS